MCICKIKQNSLAFRFIMRFIMYMYRFLCTCTLGNISCTCTLGSTLGSILCTCTDSYVHVH